MDAPQSPTEFFDGILSLVRNEQPEQLPQQGPPSEADYEAIDDVCNSIYRTKPLMALVLAMGAMQRLDEMNDDVEWKPRVRACFLTDLGNASLALGQPRQATDFFEQSLAIFRETQDRRGEGVTLNSLGNCYSDLGELRRAIEYYEQSLAILRETQDQGGEGTTLMNLGNRYAELGEPRRAIEYYEQSLAILRETQNRRGEGQTLNNLGNCYSDLGEPRHAIEYYEQSLAILRETQDRRGEGTTLMNLGSRYAELGEPRRAIEYYEQSLAILRETQDRRGEGQTLMGLGNRYAELGEPRRAIEYYEQSLAILRETQDRRGEGATLMNLGSCYSDLGEPRRAIEYYEQSLAILRETQDRRGEGQTLVNLGNRYAELGEPRRAIEYYEQSLAILRETQDRRGEGQTLMNLGTQYAQLGEPRRAIAYYEQSLAILRETHDRRGEGATLMNLGNCYSDLEEPRRAIEYYEQSLAILRETQDRRGEGATLMGLGNRYAQLGESLRAIEYYEQSLAILRETQDPRGQAKTLMNLGDEYEKMGEPRRAIQYYEQSLQQVDTTWETLTDRQRATFLQEHMSTVKRLERAHLGVDDTNSALRMVDAWRARSLLSSLSQDDDDDDDDDEDEDSADQREHEASGLRWWRCCHSVSSGTASETRQLGLLERTKVFAEHTQSVVIFYSYNKFMKALNVYVVRDGQSICKSFEVARSDLSFDDRRLSWRPRGVRSAVEDVGGGGEETDAPTADLAETESTQLKRLYGMYIGSIEDLFGGASRLVFVPDAAAGMSCIPFAALVDGSGRYLAERFTISSIPCLGALFHLSQRRVPTAISLGESVVVGNPKYDGWRLELPLGDRSRLDRAVVIKDHSHDEMKCIITAPCDESGAYEIASLSWHDTVRPGSEVRVQRGREWVVARVVSEPGKRGVFCVQELDTNEERAVPSDDCLPHFDVGDVVAILMEDADGSSTHLRSDAVVCGDVDEEGQYEVEISGTTTKLQGRVSRNRLVPRMRVPASQVVHRPDVSHILVLPNGFDRYNAAARARPAECVVSAPGDASGKYEVTLGSWDDLLDKGGIVRVEHEGRWLHGRLLSMASSTRHVCTVHIEELGQDREVSLQECLPDFQVGEEVALEAGKRAPDGHGNGTVCGDVDAEGRYEIELGDSRLRIFAKDLVRRMRVAPTRLLTRHPRPLDPLGPAEEEARTIAGILGLGEDDVLTGDRATLPEVQRRMAASTGVIHLATHGFVDPQVGGRSGVALCGASHDDAVLTAHAVASGEEKLRSPLVVLSACDTGRGEEVAEGVLGLARAFTVAGADAVIMSLWEVDDDATCRIMKLFYETWLGRREEAEGGGGGGDDRDAPRNEAELVLRPTQSVVEAWTETIRIWLDIHANSERLVRSKVYELLGMEASTGDALSKEQLRKECYKAYKVQEGGSPRADDLRNCMSDLLEDKTKYCHPYFWAAFSVVGV